MSEKENEKTKENEKVKEKEQKICGIVMPISDCDGCSAVHWQEVLGIIEEAIKDAEFDGNLVSNTDDVSFIHKTIIQNLYDNPVIVCDVSGKNPNVMFELGLRLAFDKPAIIIKDDKTSYSFDTAGIEHLEYPRDLRFSKIVEFKKKLSDKIKATHKRSIDDPTYTTFLKHFGEFKVAKIDKKEVSSQEYLVEEIKSIKTMMNRMEYSRRVREYPPRGMSRRTTDLSICLGGMSEKQIELAANLARLQPGIKEVRTEERSKGHFHLNVNVATGFDEDEVEENLRSLLKRKIKYQPRLDDLLQ